MQTRYQWEEGRAMAAALIKRHPEVFKDVPPLSDILFVMDGEAEPKSKGNKVLARVSKIPAKFDDFLEAGERTWMLEWFRLNNAHLTANQRLVLLAHELLHFEYDPDKEVHRLRGHDYEDFRLLLDRFGYRWNNPTVGDIDDILSPDFAWGKVGQARLDIDPNAEAASSAVVAAN